MGYTIDDENHGVVGMRNRVATKDRRRRAMKSPIHHRILPHRICAPSISKHADIVASADAVGASPTPARGSACRKSHFLASRPVLVFHWPREYCHRRDDRIALFDIESAINIEDVGESAGDISRR